MSGESGGTSRLNDDVVISQCDLVAERERKLLEEVTFYKLLYRDLVVYIEQVVVRSE